MADQVQARLDDMVPALRDLLNQGIFTEDEIHTVVSKRRHFEYLLFRNKTRKVDYENYIKSEEGLERLRLLRYKKLQTERKEKDKKYELRSIGNISIIQNIHSIYHRLTRKYSDDVSLYLNHVNFSRRAGSYRVLQRVIAQALNLHSKNIMLWIEVASQEFFGDEKRSGNIESSRVLFQRGIRINPTSKDLYGQYFALELHYIQKMQGRKKLRKVVNPNDKEDEEEEDSNSHELATIIYRNAMLAIPDDVHFHMHFIAICKLFPDTKSLQSFIMDTVRLQFADSPDAWIARAAFALQDNMHKHNNVGLLSSPNADAAIDTKRQDLTESNDKKRPIEDISVNTDHSSLEIIEEAIYQIPTLEMFLKSISFLKELLITQEDDNNNVKDEDILSSLHKIFDLIQQTKVTSPQLISEYATYALSNGNVSKAELILQDGTKQYPNSTDLWLQYASLAYKIEESNVHKTNATTTTARSVLRKGISIIPIYEQGHLTLLIALIEHLLSLGNKSNVEEIQTLFQTITLLSSSSNNISSFFTLDEKLSQLSLNYLHYCVTTHGSKYAQKIYPSILTSCSKNKSSKMKYLVEACVALEKTIALSLKRSKDGNNNCMHIDKDYQKRMHAIHEIAANLSLNDLDLSDIC